MEAFHGTDLDHADSIIKNGFSLIEKLNRLPNDLGRGAYFFVENNFGLQPCEMAYRFAKIYGSNSHTIVLKADIETEKTLSINFDKPEQIIAFSKFRIQNSDYVKKQFNTYEEKGKCCSILKRGNLDGILLNLFINHFEKETGKKIDFIQKNTYSKIGLPKYHLSNFPNGTEICVKNSQCIINTQKVDC